MVARCCLCGEPIDASVVDPTILHAVEHGPLLYAHDVCMMPNRTPSAQRRPSSQGLLAAIVESSEDGIISKTIDGIITSWNASAERLFGYSAGEAVGQSVAALLIPDDRKDEERIILERLRRGERIEHYETVRKTKDGRLLDISLTISPVRDTNGEIVGASKIVRDITEAKRVASELREADRRKTEFLALLAHELRNPLGPIRHAVNILRARTPKPEELEWATNIIDRQTEHLTRLVDDLLDVARLTRGTIELGKERVDVTTILMGAVEVSRSQIEKHRHQLLVTPPPEPLHVDGDATRLTQVVTSLLDNAAKFTDPGGRIWLSSEQEGDDAVIRVRDTGIGIARELLPRIFEMFTQAAASLERSHGGLGVGLALVDRLIRLHGGSVTAASGGAGAGSEFTIRLPVTETSRKSPDAGTPVAPSARATRRRVLVVDDNVDSVDSLAVLLGIMGHEVESANDGQEGLRLAAQFHPQVAILDIGLPKMNGYDLAQRLRREPWAKDLVLVALTGLGSEEHRARSAQSGFDHHLAKPVKLEALQMILAAVPAFEPEDKVAAR